MPSPRIDVVGLGPAGPELITSEALELLAGSAPLRLRTSRHPAASVVAGAATYDHLYEELATFADVYAAVVADLVALARAEGRVVYAVPGSPFVAETTVGLLRGHEDLEVVVHPALSFLDLVWARAGIDPLATPVALVDAHRFHDQRPPAGGPAVIAQCESRFTLSDVKLAVDVPPEEPVLVLQRLGLPDEDVRTVAWADLDREVDPDHLTSLYVERLPPSAGGRLDGFARLMAELRAGDPWKAEQDHHSLKRYLLEEAHEVLEAIDDYDAESGDGAEELTGELGDLLYQVVFHAELGAAAGWFDLDDVVASIVDKLERRHPHIGDGATGEVPRLEELVTDWEQAKRAEHGRASAFDGIPAGLPALLRALKVRRKAAALGLRAELPAPTDLVDGVGERLLREVGRADATGIDPEDALRRRILALEAALRAVEAGSDDGS